MLVLGSTWFGVPIVTKRIILLILLVVEGSLTPDQLDKYQKFIQCHNVCLF